MFVRKKNNRPITSSSMLEKSFSCWFTFSRNLNTGNLDPNRTYRLTERVCVGFLRKWDMNKIYMIIIRLQRGLLIRSADTELNHPQNNKTASLAKELWPVCLFNCLSLSACLSAARMSDSRTAKSGVIAQETTRLSWTLPVQLDTSALKASVSETDKRKTNCCEIAQERTDHIYSPHVATSSYIKDSRYKRACFITAGFRKTMSELLLFRRRDCRPSHSHM